MYKIMKLEGELVSLNMRYNLWNNVAKYNHDKKSTAKVLRKLLNKKNNGNDIKN